MLDARPILVDGNFVRKFERSKLLKAMGMFGTRVDKALARVRVTS